MVLFIALIYLFLTEQPYGFIFNSYFFNNIKEEHTLLLTSLKYCTSLLGRAIGLFFCGLVFNLEIKYFVIPALLISILHYGLAMILVKKRTALKRE